jgi:sugar O-acyltransferase (sialic acid O-acetyltransferase NeuD family)
VSEAVRPTTTAPTAPDQLIIVGAGGFGLEVAAYAEDIIRARAAATIIAGFLDDTKPVGTLHGGYKVLGNSLHTVDPTALYVIALGAPEQRRFMAEIFAARGARFATLLHPAAYIAPDSRIGSGSIVAPFAFIGPQTVLGTQLVVNVGAVIGHEAQIGDYGVLAPHAVVHGQAVVAEDVLIGSGAVVTNGQTIGARSKISAGSMVFSAIPPEVTAFGNPAKYRQD